MTVKREAPARKRRPVRSGPERAGDRRQSPANSTSQAKARAAARKAKAPKAVRVPLRERLIARVASIDLNPRTLVTRVPFVVFVIGSLGIGLALTLWLSTDSAERSYQLGSARDQNRVLTQQKQALEREVLEAQAAPALAESARNLGMIPSRDTAHLVQDPAGNWVVVGDPKPAQGAPPPPLNTKLPDPTAPAAVPANRVEVPVLVPSPARPAPAPDAPAPAPAPAAPAPAPAGAPAPAPAAPAPVPAAAPAPVPAAAPAPEQAPAPAPAVVAPPPLPSGPLPGPAPGTPALETGPTITPAA